MSSLKKTPGINAASMADIAFIILIFFLMVTTMGSEYGMIRQLPPWTDEKSEEKIKERNIFVVLVNQQNRLLVRSQEVHNMDELCKMAMEFFDLDMKGDHDPEKGEVDPRDRSQTPKPRIVNFGSTIGQKEIWINRGAVISLQNDRGTSYKIYMEVQDELTKAIRNLRDNFCYYRPGDIRDKSKYDYGPDVIEIGLGLRKKFDDCPDVQEAVSKYVYPMAISEAEPKDISTGR